jgi:40-residue YVTN family beta-propeller repeat
MFKGSEMMYKRSQLMKIVAVSILLLFLISEFLVMAYGSGSEKSISPSSTSGNISNTNITPFTQNSSQNNSAGYVKYTLVLFNNSLINGNFANTGNGLSPTEIAYDSSNGYVYVTNYNSNSVSVINGATNTVITGIPVGSYPWGVAYDSSNGYIYVAIYNSSNVSVINGATNKVIANIPVGSYPFGVAYDSSNGYVYVTNDGSKTVSVINGATNKGYCKYCCWIKSRCSNI